VRAASYAQAAKIKPGWANLLVVSGDSPGLIGGILENPFGHGSRVPTFPLQSLNGPITQSPNHPILPQSFNCRFDFRASVMDALALAIDALSKRSGSSPGFTSPESDSR